MESQSWPTAFPDWIERGLNTPRVVEKHFIFPIIAFTDNDQAVTIQEQLPPSAYLAVTVIGAAIIGKSGLDAEAIWDQYRRGPGWEIEDACAGFNGQVVEFLELDYKRALFLFGLNDRLSAREIAQALREGKL